MAGPLRAIALAGTLEAGKDVIVLRNGGFTINDLKGSADVTVKLNGRKKITGAISVGEIDTASFRSGTAPVKKSVTVTGVKKARKAPAAATGWSSAAIDFKPLRELDAEISVAFKSITHDEIRIGAGKLRLGLDKGLMRVDANPLAIYGGAARGTVVVNARRSIATYDLRIAAERVSALPLLKALADLDWLSGATTTRVSIAGRGLSQLQMIRTMSGTASFTFTNGAIEGMNVAKVLRGVQGGQFSNFDRVSGEKTDFSELSASFQIARGIADNKDLRLLGPLIRATGAGSANIGRRTIDYRLTPKLVASLQGQGGGDLGGLSIPLLIRGPWANPQISPDIGGVLQNPESAAAAINTIGKAFGKSGSIKSDKVKNFLDGVFGGSSGDGEKKSPLGGILGDFLQQ
jgi:AsmA protein